MRNDYSDIEIKLIALDVPTLAYYTQYFLKKMGDVWAIPVGGPMMSIKFPDDHHTDLINYYQEMHQLCSLELSRRRESVFGPEPDYNLYRAERPNASKLVKQVAENED